MKILNAGKTKTFEDLKTARYEFRSCGGSIEPAETSAQPARQETVEAEAKPGSQK